MDDAERAYQLLTIAADPPGPPILAPGADLIRRARRRQSVRRASMVATAVIVAAAAAPLALIHRTDPRLPVVAAAPLPREFGVAAPVLGPVRGPGHLPQPYCRPSEVSGRAQLLSSRYGVLAVVRLHGNRCSLRVDSASIALLDADGTRLAVPVRLEANPNPGGLIRPDLDEAAGEVGVGFAWRGSWCGPPARGVRLAAVALEAPIRTVVSVPLSGRPPSCQSRADSSYIAPGLVGRPDAPLQPPPPAWKELRATVELPPTAPSDEHVDYRVVLKNTGDRPVELTPCPSYSMLVSGNVLASSQGAAGLLETGDQGKVPCGRVLPPGGSLQLPLVLDVGMGPYARGVVDIEWAMAGVPTARAELRIR